MKAVICIHHPFELWSAPEWLGPRLQREFPQDRFVQLGSYAELDREIVDADIFIGWTLRGAQVASAKKLRWVHSTAAAVHQLLTPELVASDIVLTNSRNVQGPIVAEHVIATIFALAKRIPSAVRHQEKHRWAQEDLWTEKPRLREIAGATLGVIGFGTIARETAWRALALGMKVVAVRERAEFGTLAGREVAAAAFDAGRDAELRTVEVLPLDGLDELLGRSDFVVVAAPLTARTEGILDAARIARMKPDAYLINVSRGALVEDAALIDALREERIGGAALDVFLKEPLPVDSPYWELPNVLITPHTAAVVAGLWERHWTLIVENLKRLSGGRVLMNVVDKTKGY